MTHSRKTACALVGSVMLLVSVACSGNGGGAESDWIVPAAAPEDGGEQIRITGTVRHVELEGGFYAIVGDDGVTYDPTNLPAEFQKDGLAVEAEARRRTDRVGIHQAGPIVELLRIRVR